MTPTPDTTPRVRRRRPWDKLVDALADIGQDIRFHGQVIAAIPMALRRYPKEVLKLLSEVSFGSGALAVIGGTVGVMVGMSLFVGTVVGMQGYAALDQIGTSTLNGFISAYFNTREIAPLVAALALSATVGAGFTAQLGAMRISEEIDALQVMGVGAIPFLVSTRVVAGFIAIIPLYVIGLLTSYAGSRIVTVFFRGQSAGTYDHYFNLFLPPVDILLSFAKVLVFAVLIILIHCRLGFKASGGPAGVGTAVGHSVRRSIVTVAVLDLILSMAMWGTTTTVRIAG
ncbi:MlaE family ABC transporter permease [Mumia zhuanghuii]|uniref:ABC transporter permease n=1 Tax=Mumia zhuanghuii TaxID=2585211 RepID=A0A5C4N121_9ACTN|nr:ABC transporter permease [Mumia zhuanghuii]TNC52277.1 ABC transporter permease [Mumia zhuanghuii]